jgi:hypothetical protein
MSSISFDLSSSHAQEPGLTQTLQKGLIMVKNGQPLCEEGMGFGVPVVVKNFQTVLSFSAEVETLKDANHKVLRKTFFLDALERVKFREKEIQNALHYAWVELRGLAYKKIKPLQKLLPVWSQALKKTGFEVFFKRIEPLARITVSYRISPNEIIVRVDLSELERTGEKAKLFLLNEQGASFFSQYQDTSGLSLKRERIGGWAKVKAHQACFLTEDGSARFCLEKLDSVELYRGWEFLPGSLAWAGLIHDLSKFREPVFTYSISLKEKV